MEAVISTVSAPQPTPQVQADLRPTADAAALARDTNPTLPMAIPASTSQSGAVNEARIADTANAVTTTDPAERVLKPYGVAMLPDTSNAPEQAVVPAETTDPTES